MNDSSIYKIVGKEPGKTVAIFGGVHGNERAGILTVRHLKETLAIERGVVYLIEANPRAIEQNVRYTEKNLNRCFQASSRKSTSYEEKRACELMDILDTCDALLDLHAYNEPYGESTPFAICERDCLGIVKNFDLGIVLTNIDAVEKGGSDGYMYNNGKLGICVELGAIETPEKFVPLGIKTAYQFLQYFDMVVPTYENDHKEQLVLKTSGIYKKRFSVFTFSKPFKTFDPLKKGEIIGKDGAEEIRSEENQYILFPFPGHPVGVEVFLSAQSVN